MNAALPPVGVPPRARDRFGITYAAMWLPWLGLYAAGIAAAGVPAALALRSAFAAVLPWACLGLLVPRVVRALPWPEEGRARTFVLHAAFGLGFAVLATLGWILLLIADQRVVMGVRTIEISPRVVPWQILNGSMVYAALVSVSYARENAARVREQSARAARAELLRATAELASLRSQLNPHFILNTLHTLIGLVRREPALAEQAIERIGDLLRYGLRLHREDVDEVTLREEWEFVGSYLELERLRLGDRLRLERVAEEGVMDALVPAFVLQPLVENAIRHAIGPRAGGGRLDIRARAVDGRLRLEVQDDGAGSAPGPEGGGLGLRLLRERLGALYPGAAAIRLLPASPGVRAELDLPLRLARPAEAR